MNNKWFLSVGLMLLVTVNVRSADNSGRAGWLSTLWGALWRGSQEQSVSAVEEGRRRAMEALAGELGDGISEQQRIDQAFQRGLEAEQRARQQAEEARLRGVEAQQKAQRRGLEAEQRARQEAWEREEEARQREAKNRHEAWLREREAQFRARQEAWEREEEARQREAKARHEAWLREEEARQREAKARHEAWLREREARQREAKARHEAWQRADEARQKARLQEISDRHEVWLQEAKDRHEAWLREREAQFRAGQEAWEREEKARLQRVAVGPRVPRVADRLQEREDEESLRLALALSLSAEQVEDKELQEAIALSKHDAGALPKIVNGDDKRLVNGDNEPGARERVVDVDQVLSDIRDKSDLMRQVQGKIKERMEQAVVDRQDEKRLLMEQAAAVAEDKIAGEDRDIAKALQLKQGAASPRELSSWGQSPVYLAASVAGLLPDAIPPMNLVSRVGSALSQRDQEEDEEAPPSYADLFPEFGLGNNSERLSGYGDSALVRF